MPGEKTSEGSGGVETRGIATYWSEPRGGSLYYSAPPGSKRAPPYGIAVIFELEAEDQGNSTG